MSVAFLFHDIRVPYKYRFVNCKYTSILRISLEIVLSKQEVFVMLIYFGIKLKQLRVEKGRTQKQLAEYLNVTKAMVSKYETNAAYPSVEVLAKIADYFNVSTDYLLDRTENRAFNVAPLTDVQVALVEGMINQFNHLNEIALKGNTNEAESKLRLPLC